MVILVYELPLDLDFCSTVWNTGYAGDIRLLENVQRRWTKKVHGLETKSYADRLKELGLFSVQGCLLRADLIMCWKIFHLKSNIKPNDLFVTPPQRTSTRGHNFKIPSTRSNHDVRSRFFTKRIVNQWNQLASDTVNSSTLPQFKAKLAGEIEDKLFEYIE